MKIDTVHALSQYPYFCKTCGSTATMYLCNGDVIDAIPEAGEWDRWACCDSDECVNSRGEGHFQNDIDWLELRKKKENNDTIRNV